MDRVQAVSKNFATLAALRVISGAFEAIADPAFMLFTTMYYTRAVSLAICSFLYLDADRCIASMS
jgi:hypothetical protein